VVSQEEGVNENYFLTNVCLLAIGTFAIRESFILISGKMKHTVKLKEFFSFIPAAILPAFIFPAVFFHQGTVDWLAGKERLIVLILSGAAYYFFRSTLFIISTGLLLLYLLTSF
jgi:branched-subunit amino acid transport protein